MTLGSVLVIRAEVVVRQNAEKVGYILLTVRVYILRFTATVICSSPGDLKYGVINYTNEKDAVLSYKDNCSFTCNAGYVLYGSNMRTCQSNGRWDGTEATCTKGSVTISCNNYNT